MGIMNTKTPLYIYNTLTENNRKEKKIKAFSEIQMWFSILRTSASSCCPSFLICAGFLDQLKVIWFPALSN